MRAYVPAYELKRARDLSHALELIGSGHKPFAGGTDLMVVFEAGRLVDKRFVSLWGLRELGGIQVTPEHVTIGALTTYGEIQAHDILRAEFPMLCQAASETGAIAIQNRGTLGGNIANASPAADSPPALLAYDAELELVSAKDGVRRVAYDGFHTGYKKMGLREGELIRAVRLPRTTAGCTQVYRKVGTRKAQAISKVCFAGLADRSLSRVRIVLGSVGPIVLRCPRTEAVVQGRIDDAVIGRARVRLSDEISPIDDIRSNSNYRLKVSLNLLEDFLRACGTG